MANLEILLPLWALCLGPSGPVLIACVEFLGAMVPAVTAWAFARHRRARGRLLTGITWFIVVAVHLAAANIAGNFIAYRMVGEAHQGQSAPFW